MADPRHLLERIASAAKRIDPGFSDRDIDRLVEGTRRKRRRRVVGRVGLGVLLVGAGVLAGLRATAPGPTPQPMAALPQARPGLSPLRLRDGSIATPLDAASELAMREDSPGRVALALGRGRARFQVAPRPARLFVVQMGEVTVTVVGTVFTVERVADRTGVFVERGTVRVDWKVGDQVLQAGESGWFPPVQIRPLPAVPGERWPGSLATGSDRVPGEARRGTAEPLERSATPPTRRGRLAALAGRAFRGDDVESGASRSVPLPDGKTPPTSAAAGEAPHAPPGTSLLADLAAPAPSPRPVGVRAAETDRRNPLERGALSGFRAETPGQDLPERRPGDSRQGLLEPPAARPARAWQPSLAAHDERRGEAVPAPTAEALLTAADTARSAGRRSESVALLRRLLLEHRADARAPLAAFTLGRILLMELAQPGEAALAFAEVRALAPAGPFAEDALAREAEAWQKAGDAGKAVARAREYLRLYPHGRRAGSLRGLMGIE